jgi:hypothetical protein
MNIKIFKTREEFEKYAHFLIDEIFVRLSMYNSNSMPFEPNIPYVAYARYIEKTIHGEDASEVKGFKPSQNQRITDRLQEELIKLLTKDAEEIVLNSESYEVVVKKSEGDLQTAINKLINTTFNLRKCQDKKHCPSENIFLYINNHEVYLSKRQTIKINQAIQNKLDEYWAENPTEDEKEATRAERLWEMNEGR